jgi:rhomboid protease GluP
MKRPYLNTVYTNLILQRDYEPVKPAETSAVPDIMLLQKYRNGVYFLVQLIDGDLLSPVTLDEKLKNDYDFLLANNSNQIVHMIEVLVFNDQLSGDMLAAVHSGLQDKNIAKRYFSCFTVNLSEQMVARESNLSVDTDRIEQILKTQLKTADTDSEELPDINGLLALRQKEYTIALKVHKPTLTYALIGINMAVYLFFNLYAVSHGLNYDDLIVNFGAKVNRLILNGQYWRLISPIFLHANLLHVLVNCYSLFVLGNIVERIYGHLKYAVIYFMAGIFGSIASFIFSIQPSVGASGAIFGLLGALVYYGVEEPKIFKKYFGYSVVITIIMNIVLTFSIPGIDYSAHLGGMVGGFLTAYAIKVNNIPGKRNERFAAFLLVLFIAAVAFYFGLSNAHNLIYGH